MSVSESEWGREDSNLRRLSRRVYSPFPLAARAHPRESADCSLWPVKNDDVLVVGGGPAGSTTAIRLADGGARVLLVDKATFPRDKPCGGGITTRALAHCPVDPSPVVDFNELVGRQDYEVCERVQRGVASRAFTSGYLTDKDRYVAEFVHHYRTTLAAHT